MNESKRKHPDPELIRATQSNAILEGLARLLADGYALSIARNLRNGTAIVRFADPRGHETTTRNRALRDAIAHIVQVTPLGPVMAPPGEHSR